LKNIGCKTQRTFQKKQGLGKGGKGRPMAELPLETQPATIFNYLYSNKAISKE
jgi:hypothetical protein